MELASYHAKLEAIVALWKARGESLEYASFLRHTEQHFRTTGDFSRVTQRTIQRHALDAWMMATCGLVG